MHLSYNSIQPPPTSCAKLHLPGRIRCESDGLRSGPLAPDTPLLLADANDPKDGVNVGIFPIFRVFAPKWNDRVQDEPAFVGLEAAGDKARR